MATIKSFTDLQQSKKLAEILPLESADMHYCLEQRNILTGYEIGTVPFIQAKRFAGKCNIVDIQPAWSLVALLNNLNESVYFANEAGIVELSSIKATKWCIRILNCGKIENCYADNPIDASYNMICKLYEQMIYFSK